jgi:hypothetical protein
VLRIRTITPLVFACALVAHTPPVTLLKLRTTAGAVHDVRTSGATATAVIFVSAVCPMSMEYAERLNQLVADYSSKPVQILVINSNVNETDVEVERQRREARISAPIYRDDGTVAKLLGATATPTAVVIDKVGEIRYFGLIDNSRIPARATKHLLQSALESVLAGNGVEIQRTKVMGCSIKAAR